MRTCQEYLIAKGHTEKFLEDQKTKELAEDELYTPVLDVVKDPGCYRAVLSAYERGLSGRKDGNIENLKDLARDLGRTLIFHKVSTHE